MEPLNVLNDLKIASPCPAAWADMKGDDRTRFCGSCSKHVYNIAGLTAAEAVSLVQQSEGRLCIRLYRRKDGSVLTADCPVGLRHAVRRRLVRLATAGAVLFLTLRSGVWLYGSGMSARFSAPNLPPPPIGPGVTFADLRDWAKDVCVGGRPSGMMGGISTRSGGEIIGADQF